MKNWNYKELLEAIGETFSDQIAQGLSIEEAIGLTSENFIFHPLEDYKVENMITLIEIIFLCLENLNFVYENTIEKYLEQKRIVSIDLLKVELNLSEYEIIEERIKELEFRIVGVEIKRTV